MVNVAEDIIETGAARHAWLGITITDRPAENADGAGPQGALVTAMQPSSPADAAGLRQGDLVVRVGDKKTPTVASVMAGAAPLGSGRSHLHPCTRRRVTTVRAVVVAENPARK